MSSAWSRLLLPAAALVCTAWSRWETELRACGSGKFVHVERPHTKSKYMDWDLSRGPIRSAR
jgi:hypothetical protein